MWDNLRNNNVTSVIFPRLAETSVSTMKKRSGYIVGSSSSTADYRARSTRKREGGQASSARRTPTGRRTVFNNIALPARNFIINIRIGVNDKTTHCS